MTATQQLADWAIGLSLDDVPASAQHAAVLHLLDGLGCALAAQRSSAVVGIGAALAMATAPESATVIGSGLRRPTHIAALVNGSLVHGLDFDDTHAGGLVHATAVVLPPALAVGEEVGASGAEVLAAAIIGYEVVTRLAAAVPHGFHARGMHATSVCGCVASALIAARLRGLDVDGAVRAMGIAASTSSGLLAFLADGSATKQWHAGWASQAGIVAASLAAEGATGPAAALEDPQHGLYRALAGKVPTALAITNGLGERWEVERITVKPYPACQLVHAPLDALQVVLDTHGPILADEVRAIRVTVPPESVDIVCEPAMTKQHAASAYDAKFSLQWCLAALTIDGALTVDSFDHPDRDEVHELARRVTFDVADPGVPAADAPGIVSVELVAGTALDAQVAASRGGPALPLTDADLLAKFAANHGGADAGAAAALVMGLADLDHLDHLGPALTAGSA